MNFNMLIDKVNRKKNGQFFKMSWCTDVPVTAHSKRQGYKVYKTTTATVRKGIHYANIASVKARGIDLSTPRELPWGNWHPDYKGLIIEHTSKDEKYNRYIRLYSTPNRPIVQYFLNGQPIDKISLEKMGIVQNSYWAKGKDETPHECFTVKIENIEEVY